MHDVCQTDCWHRWRSRKVLLRREFRPARPAAGYWTPGYTLTKQMKRLHSEVPSRLELRLIATADPLAVL